MQIANENSIQVVILAGGLGSRLREETEFLPKSLVRIKEIPILAHIIEIYAQQGCQDFIVCAGYLGQLIHDYFREKNVKKSQVVNENDSKSTLYTFISPVSFILVSVRVVDTGESTLAGGRLFKVRNYISGKTFMCTYGDGVGNININELLSNHFGSRRIASVTAVRPPLRFGILEIDQEDLVTRFMEKPAVFWVSGGFFIFEKEIFDFMNEEINLEETVLGRLALEGNLRAYKHNGFWHPMDTHRDYEALNEIAFSAKVLPWLYGLGRRN